MPPRHRAVERHPVGLALPARQSFCDRDRRRGFAITQAQIAKGVFVREDQNIDPVRIECVVITQNAMNSHDTRAQATLIRLVQKL